MAKRKYTYLSFREYETGAMAEYLELMAAKGWMLNRMIQNGVFCFEKQEPRQLKFCVAVMPDSSEFESRDRAEAMQFREYCEEAGWNLLYGGTLWQIFTSEEESPMPIETDLSLQLETQRGISLSFGKWAATLALSGLFLLGAYLLLRDPGKTLASTEMLMVVLLTLGTAVLFPGILFSYLRWYRKAERMLRGTGSIPKVSLRQVMVRNWAGVAASLGVLLTMIFFTGNTGWENIMILGRSLLSVSSCFLMIFVVREHGAGNRREKAIGYFVGAMMLGTVVGTAFSYVMQQIGPKQELVEEYQRLEPFPVSFQDLGYEENESWHRESRRSMLAFYQRETGTKQDENGGESQLHLTYYESPIPLVISGTKAYYPRDRGNVWEIEKTETQRKDGIRVTRYRYELEPGNEWVEEPPVQDTYVLSDRNRLFVLSFTRETGEEELERAVALFAGSRYHDTALSVTPILSSSDWMSMPYPAPLARQ